MIDRDGAEHDVEARSGLKLMEPLRELDYGIAAICGGMCSCATCHVYIDPEWATRLPPAMSDERELLSELAHLIAELAHAPRPRSIPGTLALVVAGTGEVDWPVFFATLDELGFTGNLCIEREAGSQRAEDILAARTLVESLA